MIFFLYKYNHLLIYSSKNWVLLFKLMVEFHKQNTWCLVIIFSGFFLFMIHYINIRLDLAQVGFWFLNMDVFLQSNRNISFIVIWQQN